MNYENLKELRRRTLAPYIKCKSALIDSNGDIEKAIKLLLEQGFKKQRRLLGNPTDSGIVHAYVHPGDKIGVLVELKCQTDFVARTEEFRTFAHELSLQVASMKPKYISRDDVLQEDIDKEKELLLKNMKRKKMPDEDIKKALPSAIERWYAEICLLEQPYIKNSIKSVKDVLAELINKVGENCRISKFSRWEIGE